MIAFARSKTKSIFSKLRLTTKSKKQIETYTCCSQENVSSKKERSSNNFLEALKMGGIWLS